LGKLILSTLCSRDGVGLVFVVLILLNIKVVLNVSSILRLIKHHTIKVQVFEGVWLVGGVAPHILDTSLHMEISGELSAPFPSITRKGPQFRLTGSNERFQLGSKLFGVGKIFAVL